MFPLIVTTVLEQRCLRLARHEVLLVLWKAPGWQPGTVWSQSTSDEGAQSKYRHNFTFSTGFVSMYISIKNWMSPLVEAIWLFFRSNELQQTETQTSLLAKEEIKGKWLRSLNSNMHPTRVQTLGFLASFSCRHPLELNDSKHRRSYALGSIPESTALP